MSRHITTAWREVMSTDTVTVARRRDRTLITDRRVVWDAASMPSGMQSLARIADGQYQLNGRKFTPDANKPDLNGLEYLFPDAEARLADAPWASVTDWSYGGERIVVTESGQVLSIPVNVADAIDYVLALRATDDSNKTLGVYRSDGAPWKLVGLVGAFAFEANDIRRPVLDVIAAAARETFSSR